MNTCRRLLLFIVSLLGVVLSLEGAALRSALAQAAAKPANSPVNTDEPATKEPEGSAEPVAAPVEQQPAQAAAPLAPVPANVSAPLESASRYARLSNPQIARELRLSDEQQAKIKQILAQRDEALKQAPAADRAAVMADADKQIDELLTAEQRAHFATILRDESVRLRFSFRFQPWADVLNWFAEQADLSLVLDAPPPGTFNYSDTREYTVPEAIDLLNGVLSTKGYTLLRRERMLMLVDLSNGLPADLVPRVALEDLPRRGKYELVSVVFPIGDRNADEVKNEVQPLVGPHGQMSVLPKTKQLLVTESAGKMRAIQAVIESIPTPAAAAPAPAAPGGPVLGVYPLLGLDPKTTADILTALFPDTKIVHDAKSDQLLASTPADKKGAIETVLAQLRSQTPDDKKPRLERHAVKQANRDELLATLRVIVPEAVLRFDSESGDLIAWATPQQQAAIDQNIEKLGQGASPSGDRQLEVYALKKADPSAALALLQKMLPEARLAVDASSRSIVALASVESQRAIKATVDQLEANGAEKPTLKQYELAPQQRKRVQSLLTALAGDMPGVRVLPDTAQGKLSVWATAEQHARVREIVEQMTREAPEDEQLQVVTYRIKTVDPSSVLTVLQALLPDVKFVPDAKSKQIVAWARAEEQEQIRKTIEQVDSDLPEDQRLQLMSHPLRQASADAVTGILRSILPEAQLSNDVKNSALVAWARKRDHEVIRRAIEQAQPNTPEDQRAAVAVYPVPDADPVQLASMLSTVFPNARFSGDRASLKLVAWGTPAEQASIKKAVEGMEKEVPPERALTPVVYRPKRADVTTLSVDLRAVVPEARLAADPKHGALVAWATAADHAKIRATVEGLEQGDMAENGRQVSVYQVRDTDASTLLQLLQAAVPDGKFVPDVRAGTVMAWATAEQHEVLRKAVDELGQTSAPQNKRIAKVYRFHTSDANAAYNVLRYLVPGAYFAVDTRNGSLAVTALPAEHEQVAAMVEQMEGRAGEAQDLELRVYAIKSTEPTNVLAMLRELFAQRPEVRFSVDSKSGKLVAWALPSQHEAIREIVARVDEHEEEIDDRQIEIYALEEADPDSVGRTLNTMFGTDRDVKIITDPQGGFVTVWGSPRVQASVKAVIAQMQQRGDEVAVLPLQVIDPFIAQSSIERLFGDRRGGNRRGIPRVDIDPDGRQLLVRASAEQIAQIRAMLAKMGEPELAAKPQHAGDRRTRVLAINERTLREALHEIERVWPQLRDNPIRVVTPSAMAPSVAADRQQRESEANAEPASPEPQAPDEAASEPDEARGEDGGGGCLVESSAHSEDEAPEQPAGGEAPASEAAPEAAAQEKRPEQPNEPAKPPVVIEEQAPKKPSPAIVIAPSGDSITISSDDPEALEQFEQLLKSFVQRSASGGREFAIFHLKQANAVNVAETIQNVMAGGGFGFRGFGGNTVVADQRLNAVIVQASRNDMGAIEKLIETLDSTEQPEQGVGPRPKLIPVKNTSADRVAAILRDVYKTQLTAGGARRPMPVSQQRMSPEMSALIQQINSASTGPEMTLGVDRATNSVVVSAPAPLLKEVEALVATLDEQSNVAKPTVRVLALKRVNSKALGKALDNLIQETSRQRSGQ